MKFIDLTGKQYGRLTVLFRTKNVGKRIAWICSCSCGNTTRVSSSNLQQGTTLSCGCVHKERTSAARKSHGKSESAAYYVWISMKQRCLNPKNKKYPRYGGRGITICERWMQFENFYADMGAPPKGLSIDRVNNNGNYEPSNCRWATQVEQQNNRGNNAISTLC